MRCFGGGSGRSVQNCTPVLLMFSWDAAVVEPEGGGGSGGG
jgi:hypothetical protein